MARSLTSRSTITVNPPATFGSGEWLGGNGSAYKGTQTFTALTKVAATIPAAGGWAMLPGTRLSSVLITTSELGAISPAPVLIGTEGPAAIVRVWGSAAWNGFGWFVGGAGAHYAYYGNDMYLVRVADPVTVVRMHNPAPIAAVASRGFGAYPSGTLVSPSVWPSMQVTQGFSFPAWGPTASHQYDGLVWDASSETLIVGGDAQSNVANPGSIGEQAQYEHNVWFFNPYGATPRDAWSKSTYASGPTVFGGDHGGVYAVVDNADGTYSFRTRGGIRTVNPSNRTVMSGAPGLGPKRDSYLFWRTCFRDPATNRYFEIHTPNIGSANPSRLASIYECTPSGYSKVGDLPGSYIENSEYLDGNGGTVVRNGHVYIWNATATVWRMNLQTGAVQSFSDTTNIPSPGSNNGVWGRWAFVPEASCFVGISSHTGDVCVFRPPGAWIVT